LSETTGHATSDRAALGRLAVLMATVFVDMLGFLMVLPLLPFYAERLGATPSQIGYLVASFSAAQLVTAPLWGRLSDRWGRRPVLVVALAASGIAYVVFGLADSLWMLFISRIVQGAGGGTTGVAQAYVSDTVRPEDRAKALGWLSAATNAGVTLGPALASVTAYFGPRAPGFFAAGLCLINAAAAWHFLPESATLHETTAQVASRPPRKSLRHAAMQVFRHPGSPVSVLIWLYAFGMTAFLALNSVLALYLGHRFGIDVHNIGWFYTYIGLANFAMRTVVLGPAVRRFSELGVMKLGLLSLTLGLALMPLATSVWLFALAMLAIPVGTSLLFPATSSLVTRYAAKAEVGQTLGLQQAFGGVARMVGPITAGALFQHAGMRSPFFAASGLMALNGLFIVPLSRATAKMAVPPEPVVGVTMRREAG
jgi:multidrug resistance protein